MENRRKKNIHHDDRRLFRIKYAPLAEWVRKVHTKTQNNIEYI